MGRTPCEDGGRDHGDASTSRGTPKIVGTPPEAKGRPGTDFLPSSEGTSPADTLILDFQPSEMWDTKLALFNPPSLCGSLENKHNNQGMCSKNSLIHSPRISQDCAINLSASSMREAATSGLSTTGSPIRSAGASHAADEQTNQ